MDDRYCRGYLTTFTATRLYQGSATRSTWVVKPQNVNASLTLGKCIDTACGERNVACLCARKFVRTVYLRGWLRCPILPVEHLKGPMKREHSTGFDSSQQKQNSDGRGGLGPGGIHTMISNQWESGLDSSFQSQVIHICPPYNLWFHADRVQRHGFSDDPLRRSLLPSFIRCTSVHRLHRLLILPTQALQAHPRSTSRQFLLGKCSVFPATESERHDLRRLERLATYIRSRVRFLGLSRPFCFRVGLGHDKNGLGDSKSSKIPENLWQDGVCFWCPLRRKWGFNGDKPCDMAEKTQHVEPSVSSEVSAEPHGGFQLKLWRPDREVEGDGGWQYWSSYGWWVCQGYAGYHWQGTRTYLLTTATIGYWMIRG